MALRALCLFDGYGGFELGFRLAGLDVRTVARVERDSHAAALLVARMGETTLDQAPIWDDVTTFDGEPWAGRVDIVTAGFNCQPFSAAGQRLGVDDVRWLWPDIARIIADVGPRYVFLENVTGLVRAGLPYILADLAELGFDAEWGCLSAAAVGATHRRERFWLLAVAHHHNDRLQEVGRQPEHDREPRHDTDRPGGTDVGHTGGPRRPEVTRATPGDEGTNGRQPHRGDVADGAVEDVADPDDVRGRGIGDAVWRPERGAEVAGSGEDVADTESVDEREPHHSARPEPRQRTRPNARRGSVGAWPPRPDDRDGWERWISEGGPQPSIRRLTDGRPLGLAESLHAGGNGLVPRVAAEALAQLAARTGRGRKVNR